ncbi:MAG: hypothetical protein ACRDRY_18030 [Pseudonocardiaceae bacterium]
MPRTHAPGSSRLCREHHVTSCRYLPVSVDAISALRLPSVLSIPYGLDQLKPGLAKALG